MPQDLLTLKTLVKELDFFLAGGKIQKINQPEKDEVRFVVYNNGTSYTVVASANPNAARLHIATDKKENPYSAPAFCMLLRKHLIGATLTHASVYNDDRIARFDFIGKTEMHDLKNFTVLAELMGRYSNVILLDENFVILDSLVHVGISENGRRIIMPGAKYVAQPKGNKAELYDKKGIYDRLSKSNKPTLFDALLSSVNGLSKESAKEIVYRVGNASDPYSEAAEIITFFDDIYGKSQFKPCVFNDYGDFFVTPYLSLGNENDFVYFPSLNGAANACFVRADKSLRDKNRFKDALLLTKRHRDKLKKKIDIANEKLKECDDMEAVRISGELLSNNVYKVRRGATEITVENYYDDMRPLTIKLNPAKSPQENVTAYFNRYNKLKRAKEVSLKQRDDYTKELDYVESVLETILRAEASDADNINEELVSLNIIKKPQGKKRGKQDVKCPPKTFTAGGFTVYVGTNNILNNEVTFKIGRSYDVWLHVKNHHGSHVIIRKNNENDVIPDEVLLKAAQTAAYFSETRASDNVAVDYTLRMNVRRIKDAGVGMVNYSDYKTVFVTPENHCRDNL